MSGYLLVSNTEIKKGQVDLDNFSGISADYGDFTVKGQALGFNAP